MIRRYLALSFVFVLLLATGCTQATPSDVTNEPTAPVVAETEPTEADQVAETPTEAETATEPTEAEEESTDAKTLIVGIPDDAATFDMLFATTPRSTQVIMNAYETLMTYGIEDAGDGMRRWDSDEVEGAVLESMTVGDDGLTWTLTVRDGVTFANGDPVTAETLQFMFERNFETPASGGAFMYSVVGRIPGLSRLR